jgi:hypothetical protein
LDAFQPTNSYYIPAQDGRGVVVQAGASFRVVDLEGTQVADLWAICTDADREWLSTGHTMASVARLFPRVGQEFSTTLCQPVLRLEADDTPGVHDMLYPPCNPQLFLNAGMSADHPSCAANYLRVSRELGISTPVVPPSVNIFQNSPPNAENEIPIADALSRPGDGITFKVLRDAAIIVTACSVDFPPGNGERCTPMLLEVEGDVLAESADGSGSKPVSRRGS